MAMYSGIFTEEGMAKVKAVFTDLANPNNYPMYLHCTYGCDRTGTICYLLEALLGVSRGDCLRDYGLSNLPLHLIREVESGLANYGETLTLKQQTELYLISCGVSMDEISSIREIFLGE
jgi:protein tyrosine/serine phosphatase